MTPSNNAEVLKNKMMRGQILRTLNIFYPTPVTVGNLKTALISRGMLLTADITKSLAYLEDKGYIRLKEVKLEESDDDSLVELTADGMDLMEDSRQDVGVEI